jgi:hypothetical protein
MVISDTDIDRYSHLVLREGAMGWPTSATLRSMSINNMYAVHDLILTGRIEDFVAASWRENNVNKATQIQDLLNTLSWPQRRELAIIYIEEIDRREGAQRERRMERLTWTATVVSAVALLVSVVALLVSV